MVTHHGSSPSSDRPISAVPDQRLVGDRVGHLAEVGDQVAAAGQLAVEPVGDRRDGEHASATIRHRVPSSRNSSQTNNGTSTSRRTVRTFAMLSTVPACGRRPPADRVVAGTRPSCARPRRRRGRRPRRRRRACHETRPTSADRSSTCAGVTSPSTSGAWCAARPSSRRSVGSTSTSTTSPTRSSARWAVSSSASAVSVGDPARRSRRRRACRRSRPPRCRPRRSSRTRRSRPAGPRSRNRASSSTSALGLAGEADDDVGADAGLRRQRRASARAARGTARWSPKRRIRRSSGPLACWKDRSKYGATPGVAAMASTSAGRISAGCR